jgi:hypothetical protein
VFTPREAALWTVSITKYSWYKSGFDNIMMLNVTIENYGKGPVKDIEITCTHSAKSGTVIDRNQKTIYETFPPGRSRTIRDFNMGFIHSQAEQTFCKITDLAVL